MVRLGNASVTVIEGQVAFTFTSDKNRKENFQSVNGESVLWKIRDFDIPSWNYIGQDAKQFRHYGPMAQDFFAAFGDDGQGTIGTPTTLNSGDMSGILMIAVQALEKRTTELQAENARLEETLSQRTEELLEEGQLLTQAREALELERAQLHTRLERLELLIEGNILRSNDE